MGAIWNWIGSGRAVEQPEPAGVGKAFQATTMIGEPAPKRWADAYLAAFAQAVNLTLFTFDKALAAKAKRAVLLA